MPSTDSGGVRIVYDVRGNGSPLVLVHGYTASVRKQWELTGWVKFLEHCHRLLLVDVRGHGMSAKPHSRHRYSLTLMACDVLAAMDAAGFERADVMGYSMGAMITMELLLNHGGRFDRAVLGGMGAVFPASRHEKCRSEEHEPVPQNPINWRNATLAAASAVRHYDYFAMRSLAKSTFQGRQPVDASRLPEIVHPVLAVVGTRDMFCPGTRILEERIPDCRRVVLSGRGHINAVTDPRFKVAVRDFFAATPSRFERIEVAVTPVG